MSRKGSITYQIQNELLSKCKFGESRHEAKQNKVAYKYIYSYNTYKTFLKQAMYMVKWSQCNGIKLKSIEDIKKHGDEWLSYSVNQQKLSSYTVMLRRSCLTKLCSVPPSYFKTAIPKRQRASITRSRDITKTQKYYNEENNIKQITFCRCTGLRLSELEAITGDRLFFKDGKAYLKVTKNTKGGRPRIVEICGTNKEIELCVNLCDNAGENKVFKRVNNHVPTHSLRSIYAHRIYNKYKRDISTLEHKEIVYCRGDKKGVKFDRQALYKVSKNLGHNRIDVCTSNYLYNVIDN